MKGHRPLVGVEFMEMAKVLFKEVPDGHVFTLAELKARLDAIAAAPVCVRGVEDARRTSIARCRGWSSPSI